jgi:hypothetical protein
MTYGTYKPRTTSTDSPATTMVNPAARTLDNSEAVVREHYSYIEAGELADQMTSAFEEADR